MVQLIFSMISFGDERPHTDNNDLIYTDLHRKL